MFGILSIDKPPGATSRDVVNVVDRLVRPAKSGHAGTLDPLATGVLVVCVGPATRLIEYVQRMRKRYVGTFLLGRESPTEDIEGPVTELADPIQPTREQLEVAIQRFVGTIEQRPPQFSALKVGGRRAYDLARRGETVELAPRPVTIYSLAVARYEYPELVLEIECGGGTYVRSLGRDVAASLGTAAVMSALVRTSIGAFQLADATPLATLTKESISTHLQPPIRAVAELPQIVLDATELIEIRHGRTIAARGVEDEGRRDGVTRPVLEFAAVDQNERLCAILAATDASTFKPLKVFVATDSISQ